MCEGSGHRRFSVFQMSTVWTENRGSHTHTLTEDLHFTSASFLVKSCKYWNIESYLTTSLFSFYIKPHCLCSHLHLKRSRALSARWHVAIILTTYPFSPSPPPLSLFNQTSWLMHWGPSVTVLLPFRRLSPHLPRVIQLWLVGWRGKVVGFGG